ncbi:MAG: guanylate kinase [Betaproteobacteria bacterium TMED82]|nr:MAG: guanylate kinase [Betaproteobacteria bacterium TMED82]|tara:strand:- start:6482 stop:7063 length:582 start_codon:yes stop_codon:yes gene_type:complete
MRNYREQGKLFVISAPSGTGKTSLVKALLNIQKDIFLSVSTTTRQARTGEIHGLDYEFVTEEEFESIKSSGGFLEWAKVYGNYYGTKSSSILESVNSGKKVILEIDYQGAMQVKKRFKNQNILKLIFIKPPSLKELGNRLKHRGQDSNEVIQDRLALAAEEMKQARKFDYVIINDRFNVAVKKICSIINDESV